MKLLCSSNGIVDLKYPTSGLCDIKNAGFESISLDLSKYGAVPDIESDISIKLMIAPGFDKARECIEKCSDLQCRYMVLRTTAADIDKAEYLSLVSDAKKNNVMILLENQYRSVGGHLIRGVCSDSAKAADIIDELNSIAGAEVFGFCVNTVVLSVCGQDMNEFILPLGDRIKAVIASDCTGEAEMHLLPFTGVKMRTSNTDWTSLFRGLRTIGFDGYVVLDIADTFDASPAFLKAKLLSFAKETGDYIIQQMSLKNVIDKYPKRVLFGAGNMCRMYMKYFGEKYPPMYTCDNSEDRWGQEFCGLEIKSPEALKELPDDVAIFICNGFYRQIALQLREMDIRNHVVVFSDVYMQAYEFAEDGEIPL